MAESPHVSLEPKLPLLDAVPVVSNEMAPKHTGFQSARSFWGTLSNTNADDGALRSAVPVKKTKIAACVFTKDSVQHSSLDYCCDPSLTTSRPEVNSNENGSTRQEARDEDNTCASEVIRSIGAVPEARDSSDIMDEGTVSTTGTTEPEPSNTSFPSLQVMALQVPIHYDMDLPKKDGNEMILLTDVRDTSDIQEENVSLKGTTELNDSPFPTLHEGSSVDFQIPFHYHRDPPVKDSTKMILPSDVSDPSDMQLEESGVDFKIPFHYHRDQPVEDSTDMIHPIDVRDPSNSREGNGSLNETKGPNDISFPTLLEESGVDFQIPFHYHRDRPKHDSPSPEENSINSVLKNNVSDKANSKEEVSLEGVIDVSNQASQTDVKEISKRSSDHHDHLDLSDQTSDEKKCIDVITPVSVSYSISTSKNSNDESSTQEVFEREPVVNSTVEKNEEKVYTSTECSHDPELRLVVVVAMQRGKDEAESQQEDLPKKSDLIRSCDTENIENLALTSCLVPTQSSLSMTKCPEQNDVADDSPLRVAVAGNEMPLNLLGDPERPMISENADFAEASREDHISTMEAATQKKSTMDSTSDFAGTLSSPQLSTCSTLSGVESSVKNKDEKPEIDHDNTCTSERLTKPISQTDVKLESNGEYENPEAESFAGLESYYANVSNSWDGDARNMHKLVDIEQSRFESKYQWALERMFCGSLDSVICNDGQRVSNALVEQANDFVPKHFTSIFQEDDISLAAKSTKDDSRDDRARVVRNIDFKASVSTCSDPGLRYMYVHASPTSHSDMTEPTESTFSGRSLTERESLDLLSEKAMSLLPLRLPSTGKSAEEIKTEIWNRLTTSFEKQKETNSLPQSSGQEDQTLNQIWNQITASMELPIQGQHTRSLPKATSQEDQTLYQIWNQITASMEPVPVQGSSLLDPKQEHPSPLPEEIAEEEKCDTKEYQFLPLSLTGCTSTTSSLAPIEQPHDGNNNKRQDDNSTGSNINISSLAPAEQLQDEIEAMRQGDHSAVSFSVVNDQFKSSTIPPLVGNALASLVDMWGKLDSYFFMTPSKVGKTHMAVQTSPVPTPISAGSSLTTLSPIRPLPVKGNTSPIRDRPVNMPMVIPSLLARDSSSSSSTTPIRKTASMGATPVQQLGQVHLISSAGTSCSGAFDHVQPTGQSDEIQKGNEDMELSDFMVTQYESSSAATPANNQTFSTSQSLQPPTGIEVLLLSMSSSDEDNQVPALAPPLETRPATRPCNGSQGQKVEPKEHVEHVGNKLVAMNKAKNRLGRFGAIGRSVAKGARRTFGRTKKKPLCGCVGSTATLHHYTKS